MLTKFDSSIVVETERPFDLWCVYEHQVVMTEGEPPQVIMIGACRLNEVYLLMDGKRNSEWASIFRNGGSVLVRVVAVSNDRREAFMHAQDLLRVSNPRPLCNLKGYNVTPKRRVQCINNGQVYQSQTEASKALGVQQSTISRQLKGELEHAGGYRFVFCADVPNETKR